MSPTPRSFSIIVPSRGASTTTCLAPFTRSQSLFLYLFRPYAAFRADSSRFAGEAAEPRPGLSSGHIPNSLPCPFTSYLEPATDRKPYSSYKSLPELRDVLVQAVGGEAKWKALEGTEGKGLVFTCGSGMTAAIGWLANEAVKEGLGNGAGKTSLYDEVSESEGEGESGMVVPPCSVARHGGHGWWGRDVDGEDEIWLTRTELDGLRAQGREQDREGHEGREECLGQCPGTGWTGRYYLCMSIKTWIG
jgi:hypothetical protein